MEIKLKNLKGTKDYMPEEQYVRNNIKKTLEQVFQCYGYLPLDTPELCSYDLLASKYAGGAEILKEIYKLQDQGQRDIALRYDLTIPFAKVIGMNPSIRMPFKRYEIGKVFRDGPVKLGRNREFIQCDVDVVGISSMLAEAELISMAFQAFEKLNMKVYISYNNRKLLSGIISNSLVEPDMINEVILTLDKIEKIGESSVRKELGDKGFSESIIDSLFLNMQAVCFDLQTYIDNNSNNPLISEGGNELRELKNYLAAMGVADQCCFSPFLARGLDIYTGTVFEAFLVNGSITSSVAGGGRYDKIIGAFLDNGKDYPAVGLSFGLDVIFTALSIQDINVYQYPIELLILPLGTELEALKIAQELRSKGLLVDIEMTGRKLKKSLDFANKEKIPYVLILGEKELWEGRAKLKCMQTSHEFLLPLANLYERLTSIPNKSGRSKEDNNYMVGIH